jgi:hypothetical protein
MPPPPEFAAPPILWGTEDHVREHFRSVARGVKFERRSATVEWGSVEEFADYFIERFGPLVTARQMLGERFQDLRRELIGIWARRNTGNGRLVLPQEYLLSVVRL